MTTKLFYYTKYNEYGLAPPQFINEVDHYGKKSGAAYSFRLYKDGYKNRKNVKRYHGQLLSQGDYKVMWPLYKRLVDTTIDPTELDGPDGKPLPALYQPPPSKKQRKSAKAVRGNARVGTKKGIKPIGLSHTKIGKRISLRSRGYKMADIDITVDEAPSSRNGKRKRDHEDEEDAPAVQRAKKDTAEREDEEEEEEEREEEEIEEESAEDEELSNDGEETDSDENESSVIPVENPSLEGRDGEGDENGIGGSSTDDSTAEEQVQLMGEDEGTEREEEERLKKERKEREEQDRKMKEEVVRMKNEATKKTFENPAGGANEESTQEIGDTADDDTVDITEDGNDDSEEDIIMEPLSANEAAFKNVNVRISVIENEILECEDKDTQLHIELRRISDAITKNTADKKKKREEERTLKDQREKIRLRVQKEREEAARKRAAEATSKKNEKTTKRVEEAINAVGPAVEDEQEPELQRMEDDGRRQEAMEDGGAQANPTVTANAATVKMEEGRVEPQEDNQLAESPPAVSDSPIPPMDLPIEPSRISIPSNPDSTSRAIDYNEEPAEGMEATEGIEINKLENAFEYSKYLIPFGDDPVDVLEGQKVVILGCRASEYIKMCREQKACKVWVFDHVDGKVPDVLALTAYIDGTEEVHGNPTDLWPTFENINGIENASLIITQTKWTDSEIDSFKILLVSDLKQVGTMEIEPNVLLYEGEKNTEFNTHKYSISVSMVECELLQPQENIA